MDFKDIKIHDCITISKEHKDPEKKYWGGNHTGIVVGKSATSVTIKQANGENDIFDNSADSEEYITTYQEYSEVQFKEDIKDEIEKQKNSIDKSILTLEKMEKWYKVFKRDISLLGRLKKFLKSN